MKKDIHPQVHKDTKVTCVCGNTFVTMSVLPEIKVDICSACHPFYTGTAKFVDTEGRIDKFNKKLEKIKKKQEKSSKKKSKKATAKTVKSDRTDKEKVLKETKAAH